MLLDFLELICSEDHSMDKQTGKTGLENTFESALGILRWVKERCGKRLVGFWGFRDLRVIKDFSFLRNSSCMAVPLMIFRMILSENIFDYS